MQDKKLYIKKKTIKISLKVIKKQENKKLTKKIETILGSINCNNKYQSHNCKNFFLNKFKMDY